MTNPPIAVRQIAANDADSVCVFLHRHLNPRVQPAQWAALIRPPWGIAGPNHGFQLLNSDGQIVGVYIAVYSTRHDSALKVCNLAAFCVLKEYRSHSLRLLRALLRQRGYVFTDLSPSGSVPAINDRLGFRRLDITTRLVLTGPHPAGRDRFAVTEDAAAFEATLQGVDARIYRDHRNAAAAHHLLVHSDEGYAYLIYRRDRRKRLPVFASPLYVGGDRRILEAAWPSVSSRLWRKGLLAVLAERRVLGFCPSGMGLEVQSPRPRMYRGDVPDESVDYLYSELTLLQW